MCSNIVSWCPISAGGPLLTLRKAKTVFVFGDWLTDWLASKIFDGLFFALQIQYLWLVSSKYYIAREKNAAYILYTK